MIAACPGGGDAVDRWRVARLAGVAVNALFGRFSSASGRGCPSASISTSGQAACSLSLKPHASGVARDPHAGLPQPGIHHIGGHGSVHHRAGTKSWLTSEGFTGDDAAQGDPERASPLQVQLAGEDAVRVRKVERRELIQSEGDIPHEVRDDATALERQARRDGIMETHPFSCETGCVLMYSLLRLSTIFTGPI